MPTLPTLPTMSLLDMMSGLGAASTAAPPAFQPPPQRHALVLCDLQEDALNKLDPTQRERMLTACVPLLAAARLAEMVVVFSGLRFPSGYEGVSHRELFMWSRVQIFAHTIGDFQKL